MDIVGMVRAFRLIKQIQKQFTISEKEVFAANVGIIDLDKDQNDIHDTEIMKSIDEKKSKKFRSKNVNRRI